MSPTSKCDPPDSVINDLLGKGLRYSDWESALKNQPYIWNERVKNILIRREYEYFKEEILSLHYSEPAATGKLRKKTNSLESILKRLKGKKWDGELPGERDTRLATHRLLGKDANIRTLQKYVQEWKTSASSGTSRMEYPGNNSADGDRPRSSISYSEHESSVLDNAPPQTFTSDHTHSDLINANTSHQGPILALEPDLGAFSDNDLFGDVEYTASPSFTSDHYYEEKFSHQSNTPGLEDHSQAGVAAMSSLFGGSTQSGNMFASEDDAGQQRDWMQRLEDLGASYGQFSPPPNFHSMQLHRNRNTQTLAAATCEPFGDQETQDDMYALYHSSPPSDYCHEPTKDTRQQSKSAAPFGTGSNCTQKDSELFVQVEEHDGDNVNQCKSHKSHGSDTSMLDVDHHPLSDGGMCQEEIHADQAERRDRSSPHHNRHHKCLNRIIIALKNQLRQKEKELENEKKKAQEQQKKDAIRICGLQERNASLEATMHQHVSNIIMKEAIIKSKTTCEDKADSQKRGGRIDSRSSTPLTIVTAGSGSPSRRAASPEPIPGNPLAIRQPTGRNRSHTGDANPGLGDNNFLGVEDPVRQGRSHSHDTTNSPETSSAASLKQIFRKFSDKCLGKTYREDKNDQAPPIPVARTKKEIHSDTQKRFTSDSGYASIEVQVPCYTSELDADILEQGQL